MVATYVVKFTPDEHIDYSYKIVCITEREKFCIQLKAIGARGLMSFILGLIDLPDEISFPESPVRVQTVKTLLIRNIGDADANFKLQIEAPFSVSHSHAFLKPEDSMQIDVNFNPKVEMY